jgi:branched-subunit amino acid ABC-type transport system permease component
MVLGQYVIAGLTTASIYALISLGVTMMYGVARVLNVANAMMFGLAGFLAYELVERGVPYGVAAAIALVAVVALGQVTFFLFFVRQLERPFSALVISLGLVVVLQASMIAIWGLDIYRIDSSLSKTFTIGSTYFVRGSVLTIVTTVLVTGLLFWVLRATALGRAMRAVQEDPDTAVLLGIRSKTIIASTFAIGTALAALGGVLAATYLPFTGDSATGYGVKTFAIAIVGGLGRPVGAVLASVLLAAAETFPTAIGQASWSPAFLYATLVVILLLRPQGLLGSFGHDHGLSLGEGDPAAIDDGADEVVRGSLRRTIVQVVAGSAVLVAFLVAAPMILPDAASRGTGAYAAVLIMLAYAVWLPLRFIGVPSMGHVAIFGAASYVVAVGTREWELGLVERFVVGGLVGLVLAFAMALITLRVRGLVAAAAVTLGIAGLMTNIMGNLDITGGTTGMTFVTPLEVLGTTYNPRDTDIMIYSIGAVFIFLTAVLLGALTRSRLGRTMIAVRDSESLAISLGLRTYWVKVAGFTVSGLSAGVASVLYVHFNRYLDPTLFHDTIAINLLLAVIVGGSVYLFGPLVGGLMLAFLPELLPWDGVMNRAVYGLIVVLIATFANNGLLGWAHGAYRWVRRRRAPSGGPDQRPDVLETSPRAMEAVR